MNGKMDVSKVTDNLWLIFLVAVALTGLCLALDKLQGGLISRMRLRNGRPSTPGTSQPTSPEKQKTNSPATYQNVLPPQRRKALLLPGISSEEILQHILPMSMDYTTCQETKYYTPTGFSIQEIQDLGDFPDYTKLSGVPMPQAYTEFNIDTALPRPYRPFRWPYHQTMAISKMEPDWWIELENTYKTRITQRKDLYAKHSTGVLAYLPGSELACKEIMEMALQYVCARYPHYFFLVQDTNNNWIFQNRILDTEQDVRSKHPLEILLDNIPEDFAITLRDDQTGCYILRAGVICSSIGWSLDEKIGLPLHLVHAPVPDYKEKMQTSMERFFTKLPIEKPIQRGSWGLEIGQPLWVPKGSPDEAKHPRMHQDPTLPLEDIHLRVDWQTLRRLPLSAAVVFNFKALFTPISEFRDEPGVPGLVGGVLREGKRELLEYKGTWCVEHVVLPWVEEWEREQRRGGVVAVNSEVRTLEEGPYFRGWREKWHRQQGF